MRHKLVHHYEGCRADLVYDTITSDVPEILRILVSYTHKTSLQGV